MEDGGGGGGGVEVGVGVGEGMNPLVKGKEKKTVE